MNLVVHNRRVNNSGPPAVSISCELAFKQTGNLPLIRQVFFVLSVWFLIHPGQSYLRLDLFCATGHGKKKNPQVHPKSKAMNYTTSRV